MVQEVYEYVKRSTSMNELRGIPYKGGYIPVKALVQAMEDSWQNHLKILNFSVYSFAYGYKRDNSITITNEEIRGVLQMPKVGKRMSYSQASKMRCDEGLKIEGEINFDSYLVDIVTWAKSRGLYIEFEDGELEIKNCSGKSS
jgi:hypothetical protein